MNESGEKLRLGRVTWRCGEGAVGGFCLIMECARPEWHSTLSLSSMCVLEGAKKVLLAEDSEKRQFSVSEAVISCGLCLHQGAVQDLHNLQARH